MYALFIDCPHLLTKTQFPSKVSSKLLIIISLVVALPYLWKTCDECLSILGGELQSWWMQGKVSEKLPISLGLTLQQFTDGGIDSEGYIGKTFRDVYGIQDFISATFLM